MEGPRQHEERDAAGPGRCPECGRPLEWLADERGRQGRICRGCGWVALPEVVVVRHTSGTLLRRLFPESPFVRLMDGLRLLWSGRRPRG
ncbi:MAG: hypothetical protein HY321_22720 [Armatimonadetes bacterium]|nr:hypothetical protein [Armatimonadota bacterium]